MTNWAEHYASDETPWDVGAPHPELAARFERKEHEQTVLVPGCGFGYDARFFAEAGLRVLGFDLVEKLDGITGPRLREVGGEFRVGNVLEWEPDEPFDLLFEHTFLCALEPSVRPAWAAMASRCIKPGGRLLALAYPLGKPPENGGPPFGYSVADVTELLSEGFAKTTDEPAKNTLERRDWEERWVEFTRRA